MDIDQDRNVRIVGMHDLAFNLGRGVGVFARNVHPEQVAAVMERATAQGWTDLRTDHELF